MPFLLFLIYLLFPFGELLRFDLGNSIILKPIDIIVVATAVVWISLKIIKKAAIQSSLFKPIGIFLIILLFSLIFNIYWLKPIQIFVSFLYWIRLSGYISIYFIVSELNKKNKQIVTNYMIFAGFFVSFFGFIQYVLYTNLVNLSYLGWDEHWFRLFSTFFDPNYVGAFLVLYFLFVFHKTITAVTEKSKLGILFGALSITTLIAIFLTFSRAALLSLVTAIVIYIFLQKKKSLLPFIALGLFLVGIGVILINYQATEGTKLFRMASSVARLESAQNALSIVSKSPIFGIGFDSYRYAQLRFHIAEGPNWEASHSGAGTDNSFLFILATSGIVGLAAFIYLLKKIFDTAKDNLRKTAFSLVVIASFFAVIVNSFFLNSLFYPFVLLWLWSILGITEIHEQ